MKARQRALVLLVIASAGLAGTTVLAVALRSARAAQVGAYQRDRAWLRKRAGATRAPVAPGDVLAAPAQRRCVAAVDGFATAVSRALTAPLKDRGEWLRLLLDISARATRAEREVELDRPAPALPQRMGSEGGKPVDPARLACAGKGYAEVEELPLPERDAKPTGDPKAPAAKAGKPARKPKPGKPATRRTPR